MTAVLKGRESVQPATPVLVETSRALPLVSISIGIRTGAQLDAEGKDGTTRLLARLMRRTGGGLDPHDIDTRIDTLGGSLGADVSESVVVFQGAVIARSLDKFVDLLSDVIARPGLAEAELEKLKRETLAELTEALDDDRGLARFWFRRKVFEGHPYARAISGTLKTLPGIATADLRLAYARGFVAENLVCAFAGDIDLERAQSVAERVRQALPSGEAALDTTPEPKEISGRRLVIVDKPQRTQTQILIGGLGTHPRDEDHVALLVANTIFGGTFTARLTEEVRSKRGWSYGAYSSLPIDRRRQAFSMWTFPKAEDAAACIKLELELLSDWRQKGVTQKELNWAKRYLIRSHAFSIDTATKRVGLSLDTLLYDLPEGYHDKYLERVQAVTLDAANRAVAQRISERDLLVTVVGTEAQIGSAIRDAIPDLASVEVIPFDRAD